MMDKDKKRFDPDRLSPVDRKAWYESELARLKLEELQGKDDAMLKELLKASSFFKHLIDIQPPEHLEHPAFKQDVRETKSYRDWSQIILKIEAKISPSLSKI